ncbi:MAG: histidine phosphatase family protein [Gammaproteobacteria bacterium]|nr:MAG: histidine phosphatase family protein [Gammaproteobacteria bacterium]
MLTELELIRHGEPVGGRAYRGHGVDDPLSEWGWAQMRARVSEHAESPWHAVVTSPLQRCRAFAEEVAGQHGLPLSVEERLKEVGFGRWEGCTHEEVQTRWPEEWAAFHADPVANRPQGAEDLNGFVERVAEALEELVRIHRGERVLVVAHAGVIRAALVHVLEAPPASMYRIQVRNAGITRLRHENERWLVTAINA